MRPEAAFRIEHAGRESSYDEEKNKVALWGKARGKGV